MTCYNTLLAILVYILYNVLLTCHLHIYNSNSFLIHPLYEFNCGPSTKAQLEPFGINKIQGKCFYTDFIAILVYILHNELLTCHLHIYNNNSFLIHQLYEFNCGPSTKAQFEPFGINEIQGRCFYTDFIAILVYILYNELVTCHLHIYNSNSLLIHPLYEFNCAHDLRHNQNRLASTKFRANAFIQTLLPFSYTSYIMNC